MPSGGHLFLGFGRRSRIPDTIHTMPPLTLSTFTKGALQNRVANALLVATRGFIVTALKTFYALWLEVTGLLFAILTVTGGSALYKQFRADHLADHRRAATVGLFTVICFWFTLVSFVRARRTRG